MSKIEWTETTWNPILGCSRVSEGCDHCYAERLAGTRLRWQFPDGFDAVRVMPERLTQPLRWRQPRRCFVNSLSDLFHDKIADEWIAEIFAVMAAARRHTFQVLTKRPGRMRSLLSNPQFATDVQHRAAEKARMVPWEWPLPNVWLGTSVESQKWAEVRIPLLLATPAAIRFLSCEPLLGPVDLEMTVCHYLAPESQTRRHGLTMTTVHWGDCCRRALERSGLRWVIIGGESGPNARPMALEWARDLTAQCRAANVAVFVKQLGTVAGRALGAGGKGGDTSAWPEDLRIRDYPLRADR